MKTWRPTRLVNILLNRDPRNELRTTTFGDYEYLGMIVAVLGVLLEVL